MKKLLITAFALLAFAAGSQAQTNNKNAKNMKSIPTLLFIPMEGKPQMAQGALPKASLKEAIDKVMLGK